MLMLDEYEPLIPNEVTDYYLQRVGFETEDVRLKRLLSLAAQKFISDIASDAFQHARVRTNATPSGRQKAPEKSQSGASGAGGASGSSSLAKDKSRTVLTMDDLGSALAEYGINARKPEFFL
ncbi:transcription initiation factor TFIID 23-30kDa subunit-domain-containing protein [Cantharellus anzutake]|uniref:transcription initiation factor TFIID 23-30kDa subunit-domain-containing protein n=1 Tax=Cantharellus anzutake TaxID=1750568 RepID=UPI00190730EB|nr:transcription initiation factor TFIID 23-30kDa subunit-domain-containing protein [Cantharellus anzutake]KAF8327806.1 transcription initiation factor TFIID 23-30kDa subunit-domain-containing protein [Cantharellus anzutake]